MNDKLNWLIEYEVFSKKISLVITIIGIVLLIILFWRENKQ